MERPQPTLASQQKGSWEIWRRSDHSRPWQASLRETGPQQTLERLPTALEYSKKTLCFIAQCKKQQTAQRWFIKWACVGDSTDKERHQELAELVKTRFRAELEPRLA